MKRGRSRGLSGRPQMWVYIIACLFVLDFVLCGYVPATRRLKALQEAQARQVQMVQVAAAQGAELPSLRTRLREVRRSAERYDASVPRKRALGGFLQQIAAIMTRHNLTDHEVAPRQEIDGPSQNCIPLDVTCRGTLADLFGFFGDLQSLTRLVRVERVLLENSSDFTGQIVMQMDVAVFYQDARQDDTNDPADRNVTGGANDAI